MTGLDLLICVNVFIVETILSNCVFDLECCETCDRLRFCVLVVETW